MGRVSRRGGLESLMMSSFFGREVVVAMVVILWVVGLGCGSRGIINRARRKSTMP